MKVYMFEKKRIPAENFDGKTIKEYEAKYGDLIGVQIRLDGINGFSFVPVQKDIRYISYNGETHTFKEWAKITGINEHTLKSRYYTAGERGAVLFREVGK